MRWLIGAAALAALGYAGICAALFFLQRSMLYFPVEAHFDTPRSQRTLEVPGARLLLSVREHPGPAAVLYFGGNGEDVSGSVPALGAAFPDAAAYLLHYRGYGGSSGAPTEQALFADALALFDEIHREHAQVTLVGRSLGSGIALYLASVRPVTRVVLVTPYDSIVDIAAAQFAWIPVHRLMLDKYESWRYVPGVSAPVVILAAGSDEVIPSWSTQRLYGRFAPGRAQLRTFAGFGHNTISEAPGYAQALAGPP